MAEHDLLALAEQNPYTGTAQQVMTLCIGIYEASVELDAQTMSCLLYTSPSPRDVEESRMPSSA